MADMKEDQTHNAEHADNAPNVEDARAPNIPKDPTEDARPPSAQQAQQVPEAEDLEPGEDEEYDSEDDADPADEMAHFNWEGLHERYHDTINTASAQEQELLREFSELVNYFNIWANAGANQESDRTFHRLRTRMTYVQNSEQKLENTRQHYIGVVQAFESALNLLRNSGFGG
ncbi:uncharacterized protein CC84DRAFT_1215502 [Paraphaeosphaeria sporulosa]|uniref:Uncharacterized protein n=1 Tax=Paraphaeosphaeria sporulosa TaxID=1460663 RepID=A0A177CQL1_9PLEO|nr:uncharacterized protein CC84DRAFT_1215502 [Paraphaeosphaeria sporulosa]OAG09059.1 hypothetical protein CC84DRAFT_1215502 [Paraphaeosphaeria sporulosa]